jgi:hypothetical protein
MRSTVLCCAALAGAAFVGSFPSQSHAQNLNQVIAPENRAFDFGAVARAASTEHRFVIKNPFDANLHIRSVRASCGCTTPMIENDTIPPGGEGAVLARFNTGSFTGQRSATITVSIDRPVHTELQLTVQGYIRSDIVFTPGEVSFGAVPEGAAQTRELTLNYAGRQDWAVTHITSPAEFITATFEERERAGGRVSYKLNVQLADDAPAGFFQNQLVLHTNDRRLTSVPLRVAFTVEPALQSSPVSIALGRVKPGEPVAQRLVLKGQEPFTIEEIMSEQAEIRFEQDTMAKRAFVLNLIVTPRNLPPTNQPNPDDVRGELLVRTSLLPEPLRIPLSFTLERQGGQSPSEVALNIID